MDLGSVTYLKRFFGQDLEQVDDLLFSHYPRMRNSAQCKQFYSGAMKAATTDSALQQLRAWMPEQASGWAPLHRAQYIESRLLMDGYLLSSQGDRMLMANSIEGRFPFLDPRVIMFANGLSARMKHLIPCCLQTPGFRLATQQRHFFTVKIAATLEC